MLDRLFLRFNLYQTFRGTDVSEQLFWLGLSTMVLGIAAVAIGSLFSSVYAGAGIFVGVVLLILLRAAKMRLDFQEDAVNAWTAAMRGKALKSEAYGEGPFELPVLQRVINDARQTLGASQDWKAVRRPVCCTTSLLFGRKTAGVERFLPNSVGFGDKKKHPIVAAHEAAHTVTKDAHGPEFARVFADMVSGLKLLDRDTVLELADRKVVTLGVPWRLHPLKDFEKAGLETDGLVEDIHVDSVDRHT